MKRILAPALSLTLLPTLALCMGHLFQGPQCMQINPVRPAASALSSTAPLKPAESSGLYAPGPGGATTANPTIETLTFTVTTTKQVGPSEAKAREPSSTHVITVNANRGDLFTPRWVSAADGDVVRFRTRDTGLQIIQSTLQQPCQPNGRFDSRSWAGSGNRTYVDYMVQGVAPAYFYGKPVDEAAQCRAGILFAINSDDDFRQLQTKWATSGNVTLAQNVTTTGLWRRVRRS